MQDNKPIILFVDDEEALLNALRRAYFEADFKSLFATDGSGALKLLEEQSVQVVVADMQMPDMSGLELHRQIRARFPTVIRVLLSGYPNPDPGDVSDMVQALHRGDIFRFVAKDADMLETVQEVVNLALEQYHRLTQEGIPVSH